VKVYVVVDEKGKVIKAEIPRWTRQEALYGCQKDDGEKVKALTVVEKK
jgi:hypothetical protein